MGLYRWSENSIGPLGSESSPLTKPVLEGNSTMRVVVMIRANRNTEAGVMPSEALLTEMGKYNEELVNAGVMLAGEGLHPSSKGARVNSTRGKISVTDGPFTE